MCVTNAQEMAELVPAGAPAGIGTGPDDMLADGSGRGDGPPSAAIRVLDALSARSPRTTSDVAARAGISLAEAQAVLGPLQLDGSVAERERGWIRR